MASRVIEAGSIVSRTSHLLRCRVLKERPLWLDVVEAFPPSDPTAPHRGKDGRARVIKYEEDSLKRYFSHHFVVVARVDQKPVQPVQSLHEDHPSSDHDLIDTFIREQLKGISLGKSKCDAAEDGLSVVKDSHPHLMVVSKEAEQTRTDGEEAAMMSLESTLLGALNVVT